jgi:yeast amino acid transporter
MRTLTGRWSDHNLPVLPYLVHNLRPILIRSSGIAFSGTVGMGIWTNTGELISISGSAGCVIGYTVSAFFVTAVMRSLAEMVSVRPFAGAMMDFPATFVDPALGFAVGVTYWYVAPSVSSAFR